MKFLVKFQAVGEIEVEADNDMEAGDLVECMEGFELTNAISSVTILDAVDAKKAKRKKLKKT